MVISKNLQNVEKLSWAFTTLWTKLLETLEKFNNWEVKFCRRSQNKIAYILAKLANPILMVFGINIPLEIRDIHDQAKATT